MKHFLNYIDFFFLYSFIWFFFTHNIFIMLLNNIKVWLFRSYWLKKKNIWMIFFIQKRITFFKKGPIHLLTKAFREKWIFHLMFFIFKSEITFFCKWPFNDTKSLKWKDQVLQPFLGKSKNRFNFNMREQERQIHQNMNGERFNTKIHYQQ